MKKINKKQKKIMRVFGTLLFAIALILTLDLVFNHKKEIDKKYIGTWFIAYEFTDSEDDSKVVKTYTQELHLSKDGTFYTIGLTNEEEDGTSATGTYSVDNDEIDLVFYRNSVKNNSHLYYKDNKLCNTADCKTFYTKDKLENYFVRTNNN